MASPGQCRQLERIQINFLAGLQISDEQAGAVAVFIAGYFDGGKFVAQFYSHGFGKNEIYRQSNSGRISQIAACQPAHFGSRIQTTTTSVCLHRWAKELHRLGQLRRFIQGL